MTIFNTGYSAFDYEPVSTASRVWPLIRMEFQQLFRTKKGLLVFILCIAFIIVKAVVIWAQLSSESEAMAQAASILPAGWSPFKLEFYMNHSTTYVGFVPFLLLTTLVGVRSIAGDKEANALEIYWTRGISPWGYFLGKWMGSFLLLGAVYFAGPLVLWLYGLISAPDLTYMETTIVFMPRALAALALKCLVLSFMAVAVSAISSSGLVACFLWLLLILGTTSLGETLTLISRVAMRSDPEALASYPWYSAICPWHSMIRIESDIAGLAPRASDYDQVWIAWAWLAGYALLLVWRLRKQLRTTEVVG